MAHKKDLIGLKFGKLTVVSFSHLKSGAAYWICDCECGQRRKTPVPTTKLWSGKAHSCGCSDRRGKIHGGSRSISYRSWLSMKARCYYEKLGCYQNYGGRGIRICDRWLSGDGSKTGYECFVDDLGARPSTEYSIDRLDYDGNYEPSNCRWATDTEQMRNTSRTRMCEYNGDVLPLIEAAEKYGKVGIGTVYQRLWRGWPLDKALELPRLPNGRPLKR